MVSIHAPAGGATVSQSPVRGVRNVSIHAPAKGATAPIACDPLGHVVSIHAPAKGATSPRDLRSPGIEWFQSTPPRRGRHATADRVPTIPVVSIHAPAKGATAIAALPASRLRCFNPRPREGGDPSTNSAFCLQRNPSCPCEMVTSAGTSEPFSAENFGKPHELNCLNEVRTFHGRSRTLEVRACHDIKRSAGRRDQRPAWRRHARPACANSPRESNNEGGRARARRPSEQFNHLDRFRKAVVVHRDFIVRKPPGRRVVTEAIAAGFNKLVPYLSMHTHAIEQSMGMGIAEC